MAGRTLAQVAGLDDPTTEDAPAATWDFRACACGVKFFGPATRTQCLVCRIGATTVVRIGRGVSEDDEAEGNSEMPQSLGVDEARVREMIQRGTPAAVACHALGLTAKQFAFWCYRNHVKYPGVPTPNTAAVAMLQAEADQIPETTAEPSSTTEPDPLPEPSAEDAHAMEPTAPVPTAVPLPVAAPVEPRPLPNPFRQPLREGGLVLPIRIEGNRIVLREPEVEGDITEVEAAHVLAWLRGWLQERGGVEVVVEPCA